MKQLDLVQGSQSWLAARVKYFTASEAPAMLGLSKYKTRSELLREKATGIVAEVDAAAQRRFDAGHEAEAKTRAWAERFIGEDLYPITGTLEVDGLPLLASFDGLTMDELINWENKLWNEEFAAQVRANIVPDTHWPQLEHQMIVSGAIKVLFTVSDGAENIVSMWYESVPERRARVLAGWKQFAEDVKNYQHVEVIPAAVAAPIKDLPAIVITAYGSMTIETNFTRWGVELREFIAKIPARPETDQDFADCKAAIAAFKTAETMLDSEEKRVLSMVESIEEMQREKKLLRDLSSTTRLSLEKLVVSRDLAVKAEIIQAGKDQLAEYVAKLNDSIGGNWMPAFAPDFASAIKNKRSYEAMRSSVADLVAQKKVEAKGIADRISENLKLVRDDMMLIPDFALVCTKSTDDFANLFASRVHAHRVAEDQRIEAEREKIRAEEQAKAAAEAQAKAKMEEARIRAEEQEKSRAANEKDAKLRAELQLMSGQAIVEALETLQPTSYEAGPVPDEQAAITTEQKAAAVIEHQDEIAQFMASRDWGKDAGKIRAVLVEYEKFKLTLNRNSSK